jgi:hypothetical protein
MGWLVGSGDRDAAGGQEPKLASKLTSEPELAAEEYSREERLLDMQAEAAATALLLLRGLW